MNGTPLCPAAARLDAEFPVRKSRAQKAAFREALTKELTANGWPVTVQDGGTLGGKNLIAGNPKTARLILTAHYDTPARMPLPNFVAAKNYLATLLAQLWMLVLIFVVLFGSVSLFTALGLGRGLGQIVGALLCLGLLALLMAGPANPSNRNDNTSGVLTLVEVANALPPDLMGNVALVFFDLEELGLLGSAAFRKAYGPLEQALLLNFDCVGDGDHILFIGGKLKRNGPLRQKAVDSFLPSGNKTVKFEKNPFVFYPSDQANFRGGVGVAAFHKKPLIGPYVSRIHTKRDTVLDEENLRIMRDGALRLAEKL